MRFAFVRLRNLAATMRPSLASRVLRSVTVSRARADRFALLRTLPLSVNACPATAAEGGEPAESSDAGGPAAAVAAGASAKTASVPPSSKARDRFMDTPRRCVSAAVPHPSPYLNVG